MDDVIMEKITRDLEEADAMGDKFAGALLEVLALVMKWKSSGSMLTVRGMVNITDPAILHKQVAGQQILSAIEKGMT